MPLEPPVVVVDKKAMKAKYKKALKAKHKKALKTKYIGVLIEKAATSDDDKLLDRIEALLRENETND